jgi:SAM-dependent methyltransferase
VTGPAVQRWGELVRARGEAMAAAAAGDAYPQRLLAWARSVMGTGDHDPLLPLLRAELSEGGSLLDVGSGAGRFAVPLAGAGIEVVAVEPNSVLVDLMLDEAERTGAVIRVRPVPIRFEDVPSSVRADVVLCSYVLPLVADAGPFVAKLHAAARRRVVLALAAFGADPLHDLLWERLHGQPLPTLPTWLDAADLVAEVTGVRPVVDVLMSPQAVTHADLGAAVEHHRMSMTLPDDDVTRATLRELLGPWYETGEGGVRAVVPARPTAVLRWAPAGLDD